MNHGVCIIRLLGVNACACDTNRYLTPVTNVLHFRELLTVFVNGVNKRLRTLTYGNFLKRHCLFYWKPVGTTYLFSIKRQVKSSTKLPGRSYLILLLKVRVKYPKKLYCVFRLMSSTFILCVGLRLLIFYQNRFTDSLPIRLSVRWKSSKDSVLDTTEYRNSGLHKPQCGIFSY